MRHLLLIDTSIKDLAVFQGCINSNTDSIVFDFTTETLATLQTKLSAFGRHRQFKRVGIVQENGPANKFIHLVTNQDLVQWIVDKTKCIALDLFTCNIMTDPKWRKTIKMIQTTFPQIALGASDDITGNIKSGGDWIAETGGTDLKAIYLTDAISQYKGTFGLDSNYNIILDGSGGCYVMGDNYNGPLGLGMEKAFGSISPPQYLTIPGKTITQVEHGYRHTIFLCSDGTVYSCGDNSDGKLGLGNTNTYYSPTQIDLSNITTIACGTYHSMFLRSDGTVYGCGSNYDGQLGVGTNSDYYDIPTQVVSTNFSGTVTSIACGEDHTMFLCSNGTVYGTGNNGNGQLGIGNTNYPYPDVPTLVVSTNFSSTVTSIACGGDHTLFLCANGSVYGTGENGDGELGIIDGDGNYDVPTQIDAISFSSGVGMIFCGHFNSFFVCLDGNVYGCGYNENYSLGINHDNEEYTPVLISFFSDNNKTINYIAAAEYFTIFVCSDRTVYGTGDNGDGQLGDGSISNILSPTLFSFTKTVTSLSIGERNSLFICSDGTVYSCGSGDNGALGLGDNIDVSGLTQVTTNIGSKTVTKVAVNKFTDTSIFLCSDGTVYSCGNNSQGQLGLGDNITRNIPTQITDLSNITEIVCGGYHTLFLDAFGNAYGCGNNGNGQLGINGYSNPNIPTPITDLSNISMIAAGIYHTIFVCTDGTAYSSGGNTNGELGLGYNGGSVAIPTLISGFSNVTSASCGWYFSIIMCSDGTVYGCGQNYEGQLGLGSTSYENTFTQITDLTNISAISCGTKYSLFLDGSGNVYGTGDNYEAQLGLPITEDQIDNNTYKVPTQITVGDNKVVSKIIAGDVQSAFFCNDNTLYVCGENGNSHSFGLKYVDEYTLPTLATFNATIESNLVVCFGEGTEILTMDGDNETYVKVEKLRPGAIVKTYKHGPQVIKKIGTGSMINNSDDPKKCMFKMEKQGNMTADLCLTGGHAILKDCAPKGLQFKIDDKYLHFVENLPEFKKMEAIHYKYYNFCFENDGDCDLRYGVWANGVLCETPSEKQLDSFEINMLV